MKLKKWPSLLILVIWLLVYDTTYSQSIKQLTATKIGFFNMSEVSNVAWSPDGKKLAIIKNGQAIWLWKPPLKSLNLITDQAQIPFTQWSPDSTTIAAVTGGEKFLNLRLWDADTGKLLKHFTYAFNRAGYALIYWCAWSPNGKYIASADATREHILLWDPLGAQAPFPLEGPIDGVVSEIAWSPDSSLIASGDSVWNVHTGKIIATLSDSFSYAWHPISNKILAYGSLHKVIIYNIESKQMITTLNDTDSNPYIIRWNYDGTLLAAIAINEDASEWVLKIWDVQSGQVVLIIQDRLRKIFDFSWHPNTNILATMTRKGVTVWQIDK